MAVEPPVAGAARVSRGACVVCGGSWYSRVEWDGRSEPLCAGCWMWLAHAVLRGGVVFPRCE